MNKLLLVLFGGTAVAGIAAYAVENTRKKNVESVVRGSVDPNYNSDAKLFAGKVKSPIFQQAVCEGTVIPLTGVCLGTEVPFAPGTPVPGTLEPSTTPITDTLTAGGQASSIFSGDTTLKSFDDNQAGYSTDSLGF